LGSSDSNCSRKASSYCRRISSEMRVVALVIEWATLTAIPAAQI
jgi:hypothetical protein